MLEVCDVRVLLASLGLWCNMLLLNDPERDKCVNEDSFVDVDEVSEHNTEMDEVSDSVSENEKIELTDEQINDANDKDIYK